MSRHKPLQVSASDLRNSWHGFLVGERPALSWNRPLRSIVLVALCAGVAAGTLEAQEGPGRTVDVTGIVADVETGVPIRGAVVEVPEANRLVMTDDDGRFVLLDLPAGPRGWRVSALGYSAWEQELEPAHLERLKVGLMPRPVALENLRVTVDRLETRRRLSTVSVVAVERAELLRSTWADAVSQARSRSPYPAGKCPQKLTRNGLYQPDVPWQFCVRYRGGTVKPAVWVDELRVPMEVLMAYHPSELYAIEYYGAGLSLGRNALVPQIRVYTADFMERGRPLKPLFY